MSFKFPTASGITVDDHLVNRVVTLNELTTNWENQMRLQQTEVFVAQDANWPDRISVTPTTDVWLGNAFLRAYGRGDAGIICPAAIASVEFRVNTKLIREWVPVLNRPGAYGPSPYLITLLTPVTPGFLTRIRDAIAEVNAALAEKWTRGVYPAGWVGP